ncbi:EscR/YscR/HrcR family type III secretion system export apparatus protein [Luteimonas qiangzhengi]|uniref:EscR/YscR/HrcR family type III secretion system export apparatus protein n=1 Tax=Luteimonas sp. MJ146 TaxID=3129240 RepID=UPI0031BB4847
MDFSNYSPALVLLVVVSLALAPFVAVMVTSFTKMVVVLSLLRNALGLQQVPPNVVINGLAIVLSIYVMYPVILDTHAAITAHMEGRPPPPTVQAHIEARQAEQAAMAQREIQAMRDAATEGSDAAAGTPASPAAADALQAEARAATEPERGELFRNVTGGVGQDPGEDPQALAAQDPSAPRVIIAPPPPTATGPPADGIDANYLLALAEAGKEPLRTFLIDHSHRTERQFFLNNAKRLMREEYHPSLTINDFIVVIPAFTVSELTAAFQIGFLIFLPFLIIDLVVANILLALGMMMMSPTIVSLPFKLLLFVLVDGWAKLVHGLVLTYAMT